MPADDTRDMILITNYCPNRDAEELFLPALKAAHKCEDGTGQMPDYRGIYAPKENATQAKDLLKALCDAYRGHFEQKGNQ